MANIPVEKKKSGGWWKWLLGLLVLLLGIWFVFSLIDEDEPGLVPDTETFQGEPLSAEPAPPDEVTPPGTTRATTPRMTDTTASGAGVLTSMAMILDAPDRMALVGRDVRLAGLHVAEVVGDSVFYVTPEPGIEVSPDNRVLIAGLDEIIPAPPPDVEGRYDVTEGQVVTLFGSVERIRQEHPSAWGITPQEGAEMLEQDRIYLRAQRLEITDRP